MYPQQKKHNHKKTNMLLRICVFRLHFISCMRLSVIIFINLCLIPEFRPNIFPLLLMGMKKSLFDYTVFILHCKLLMKTKCASGKTEYST